MRDDPAQTAATITYRAAEDGSRYLKQAIREAIATQAKAWGIRPDQAAGLLLDRKVVA